MIVSSQLPTTILRPGICWEEPECLLCGGERRSPVLEAPDMSRGSPGLWFAVVRCDECGLHFTSPRPDAATIGQFYTENYGPHQGIARKPTRPVRHAGFAKLLGRPCLERRSLPWHGDGRLLDFGCGRGSFLDRMRGQGWQVVGLDNSHATVERVRAELGVPVLCGTLPHAELEPESFDVITMWHSLEHVHEPLAALQAAHGLLSRGGRLVIAVPNFDSAPARRFGPAWFGLDLPRHLTHFTRPTMRRMLEQSGFAVTSLRLVRHSDWLRSSAKLSAALGRSNWRQRLLTNKRVAKLVTLMQFLRGQSDCMLATAEKV
jgi:2-polyprenyl-3-methyl-5-hydroxy-6-metoxy-1,4-benzoquinol methylase